MTAQAKSRAAEATADAADQGYTAVVGSYSEPDPSARASKVALTKFKFRWMRQVALDPDLPPQATRIAVLIAGDYLNSETMDAWPALNTLAKKLNRSINQVRTTLQEMTRRRHLEAEISAGGKGQTSRYKPILLPCKPSTELEGLEGGNPPEKPHQTLQKNIAKPSSGLEGIPLNTTFEESRTGSGEPVRGYSSTLRGSRSAPGGASPTSSSEHPPVFRVGEFRRNSRGREYTVEAVDREERTVSVRWSDTGTYSTLQAPSGAILKAHRSFKAKKSEDSDVSF